MGRQVFSVLMKSLSLFEIETYNEEAYPISGRIYPPYFQIYFISVNVNVDDIAIIRSSQYTILEEWKGNKQTRKEKFTVKKRL